MIFRISCGYTIFEFPDSALGLVIVFKIKEKLEICLTFFIPVNARANDRPSNPSHIHIFFKFSSLLKKSTDSACSSFANFRLCSIELKLPVRCFAFTLLY